MHRMPQSGDVVRLPKSRFEWVIINATTHPDEDGGILWLFTTIKETDLGKDNPKERQFQLDGFTELAERIALVNVEFVRQIKVKAVVRYEQK